MKKIVLSLIVVFLFSNLCIAGNYSRSVTRDGNGRVVKTVERSGNKTTTRDGQGRVKRTVTKSGNTTTTRDGNGKIIKTTTRTKY